MVPGYWRHFENNLYPDSGCGSQRIKIFLVKFEDVNSLLVTFRVICIVWSGDVIWNITLWSLESYNKRVKILYALVLELYNKHVTILNALIHCHTINKATQKLVCILLQKACLYFATRSRSVFCYKKHVCILL